MLILTEVENPQLNYIAPDEVPHYWPLYGKYILAAEAKGGWMGEEKIVWNLLNGVLKLFVISREGRPYGACTVEIVDDTAIFQHLGGDLFVMARLLNEFETWLKALGAKKIRLSGRRGWARKAVRFGYVEKAVVMEKEIA